MSETRWRISNVAQHLGVTRQRAQQLAHTGRLPQPAGQDRIGPYWDAAEIRAWAERWARERRWRRLRNG
jgi:predicted DNA-binding transcriptional regulator AlpA